MGGVIMHPCMLSEVRHDLYVHTFQHVVMLRAFIVLSCSVCMLSEVGHQLYAYTFQLVVLCSALTELMRACCLKFDMIYMCLLFSKS